MAGAHLACSMSTCHSILSTLLLHVYMRPQSLPELPCTWAVLH